MSALRLEVETHIVTASATAVQNLSKCVAAAGVKIDELVVDALASAEAVLSETEKELGVAVADIGAGTIDLALFQDGSPFHTRVLPVGGDNVTNDVAIGLKTSLQVAEELKISHGTCDLRVDRRGRGDQRLGPRRGRRAGRSAGSRSAQIIEARMRETFELLRNEIRAAGVGMLPAGIILTGGGVAARRASPSSAARSSRCRSGSPRRRASAASSTRSSTRATAPPSGCSSGAPAASAPGEPTRYESAPAGGGLGRLRDALRSIFP